jgi:glycosyltransferase involved in cell wall biosynthesis
MAQIKEACCSVESPTIAAVPPRSVHLTNYYHKTSGGISTAYNHLLAAADRHQRYVSLIVPGAENEVEEIGQFGKIYYVKSDPSPVFDKRYRLMLPWKAYLFDGSPVKEILRKEDPDIIEIGEKYTLSLMAGLVRKHLLTVASKRPMLVQFSCERMDDNVRAFMSGGRFGKWLARQYTANYTLPMFDFHLANSDYTAQEFFDAVSPVRNPRGSRRFFNWCWRSLRAPKVGLRERVFVNQCGVDNSNFGPERQSSDRRSAFLQEFGLPRDTRLLLYAGRISPEKNTDLLLETLKALTADNSHEYRLLIAGGGPTAEQLAAKAEKLVPGSVVMIGHITDKEKLADLFANCDVFIHPNPREPFGITPLEAMASGLPVVAPNSGGLLSYANETNAWLSTPDGESFAASIRSVFESQAIRTTRIAEGVKTAARYDWDTSIDSLFALYDWMYKDFELRTSLFEYAQPAADFDFAASAAA